MVAMTMMSLPWLHLLRAEPILSPVVAIFSRRVVVLLRVGQTTAWRRLLPFGRECGYPRLKSSRLHADNKGYSGTVPFLLLQL
jgi:hypothetical protein